MGEFSTIIFLISIGLFLLILFCIPVGIALLVYKLARKWLRRSIAIAVASIIPLFCIYEAYIAIYPGDSFYKGEFELITGMECPRSAKVIEKDASYPDFGGDYISCALIEFSTEDYNKIIETVRGNHLFSEGYPIGSTQFRRVTGGRVLAKLLYEASYNDGNGGYRYVGFFDDGKTIVVHFIQT
jgi:energy-coupling factor transporter transmembrane protein EcfT